MATYTIKNNRLRQAHIEGMRLAQDRSLLYLTPEYERHLYLGVIDSAERGGSWGRLSFQAKLQEDMVPYIHAAASDFLTIYDEGGEYRIDDVLLADNIEDTEKKELLAGMDELRFVGRTDVLLYGLKGRYLYLCIDVIGEGEGTIFGLRVDTRGDQFMNTLPSVYRENNSFLHRFLSIFSSIYNDFEREIGRLPELLDPDTCPPAVLEEYGRWLGLDLSGDFLSEEAMRAFVREGYALNRMKGTKACLMRVLEIVLGEKVIIMEQNTIRAYMEEGGYTDTQLEYGSIYDVNVLIRKEFSDTDRHQLLHLIRQFVPLRTRVHLIHLKDSGVLDTDIYLDMNAIISEETYGMFDRDMVFDDDVIMEE